MPIALTAQCVTSPAPKSVIPNASTIGQDEGAGISTVFAGRVPECSVDIATFQ
jgi:hypothetical protein